MANVERVVRAAIVRYRAGGDTGGLRWAKAGESIVVPEEVAEGLGAALHPADFDPDGADDSAGGSSDGLPVDLDNADVSDVVAWLSGDVSEKPPTVKEVVEAANDDVDRAVLLLDAEQKRDGDPRKSVEKGLRKIIDQGGAP